MIEHITGLLAAPFTPMKPNGSINTEKVTDIVNLLLANDVKGIFVCGSTGEGPSLNTNERKEMAEAFVNAANKRLKVFVHVGHNSLTDAKDLAAHAQHIGADYISATPPAYFKVSSVETLISSLSMIASGAPQLPLYYYHIPSLTGVGLNMLDFLENVGNQLPSLAGIKYTSASIHEYQACLNYSDNKFDVLYGTDEMLLSALASGAKGFIGSTYNFAAPIYHQILKAYENREMKMAQQLQLKVVEMVRIIPKYGGLRTQKAIMKLIGMDCGPVRLPLKPFNKQEYNNLEKDLLEIGFFEWVSTPQNASL